LEGAGEGDIAGDLDAAPEGDMAGEGDIAGDMAGDMAGDSAGEGDVVVSPPPQAAKGSNKAAIENVARSLLFIRMLIERQWK
jgi:hypothetical protein